MEYFYIKFEHSKWGTIADGTFMARNFQAALARGAKRVGLKAKRTNGHWQFWHNDNGINCYLLRECYEL